MTAWCIIPARFGSRRIPGKNWKDFHGKPIIEYSIHAARASGVFTELIVSADHFPYTPGAMLDKRPAHMAVDTVGTQDVIRDVCERWNIPAGDIVCGLYATAPLLKPHVLSVAAHLLRKHDCAYVMPVATWLRDPGLFYMGWADSFLRQIPLLCSGTRMLPVPASMECDINTPEDWERALRMFEENHRRTD